MDDVVLRIRVPGDLRWALQLRALEDGGWSFQDLVIAAFHTYLADPAVAAAIRTRLPSAQQEHAAAARHAGTSD